MNKDQLAGNMKQLQGTIKKQWGKLTDDVIAEANGNKDILVGKIQEAYGVSKEEASKQWDKFSNENNLSARETDQAIRSADASNQSQGVYGTGSTQASSNNSRASTLGTSTAGTPYGENAKKDHHGSSEGGYDQASRRTSYESGASESEENNLPARNTEYRVDPSEQGKRPS